MSFGRRAVSRVGVRRSAGLIAAAVAALVAAALWLSGALGALEHGTVAARFALRPVTPPTGIVVVAIDDRTFAQLGVQWPFPRSMHAAVVDRLHADGARLVVYDVQFTEPTQPRQDLALYDAIGRAGGAVLGTTDIGAHGETTVLGGDASLARIHAQAAATMFPIADGGEIDRFPYSVSHLRSMGVVAAERASGRPVPAGDFPSDGALVDYRGGPGTFRTVSFSDVLRGRVPASALRGKIVVVGATAPSLQDVHPTPVSSALMAGPEVQANAIWTALHGAPLRTPPGWVGILVVLALAMFAPLLRLRVTALRTGLATLALGVVYAVVAQWTFDAGAEIPVAGPLVALVVGALTMIVASHVAEIAERRRIARANEALGRTVRARDAQLHDAQFELVRRLAQAAESRDESTGRHIERMAQLCHRLALALGLPLHEAELIGHAAPLHDVGKIAIPDSILLKPGKLDPHEWETMKTHTTIGAQILAGSEFPLVQMAETIALTHHERWDGAGYPVGIGGEEIPLVGRIAAVCDVYDALTSRRPYKEPWSVHEALAEIGRQSGRQFDPEIVEAFLGLDLASGAPVVPESGHADGRPLARAA